LRPPSPSIEIAGYLGLLLPVLLAEAEAPILMWSFTFAPLAFSFAIRRASLRSAAEFAVPVSSMRPLSSELTLTPERFGLA